MKSPEGVAPHNKTLQLTAKALRGLSAAELGRYAAEALWHEGRDQDYTNE